MGKCSCNLIKEELIKLLDIKYNENKKIVYNNKNNYCLKSLGKEQDTIKSIRDIIISCKLKNNELEEEFKKRLNEKIDTVSLYGHLNPIEYIKKKINNLHT
ncbi:hypothetical protein [Natronospora cellulosivora (SeqCode)]